MNGSVEVIKVHNGKTIFKPTTSGEAFPKPKYRFKWDANGDRFDKNIKPIKIKKMKATYKGTRKDQKSILKTFSDK